MDFNKRSMPMKKESFFSHPGIIFLFFTLAFLLFSAVYSAASYFELVKNWNGPASAAAKNAADKKTNASSAETAAETNSAAPGRKTENQTGIQAASAENAKTPSKQQTAEFSKDETVRYSVSSAGEIKNYASSPEKVTYHVFEKIARKASSVSLSGDFNGWKKTGLPLQKNKSGIWETRLPLLPGTYSYVYIVDGEEQLDDFSTDFTVKKGRKVSVLNIK